MRETGCTCTYYIYKVNGVVLEACTQRAHTQTHPEYPTGWVLEEGKRVHASITTPFSLYISYVYYLPRVGVHTHTDTDTHTHTHTHHDYGGVLEEWRCACRLCLCPLRIFERGEGERDTEREREKRGRDGERETEREREREREREEREGWRERD
jgi:hypothetical protein